MRIAVISDIHSNLRAWNAVLADIASLKADRILCLGDLVGYGPSPVEVLESAYRHVHGFVLGNHDAVVAGKMSPDVFNDSARRLILWTRDRIGPRGARFLGQLPLVLSGNGMRCAHANFVRPAAFDYVLEPEDAAASWAAAPEQILFVGHTHVPQLFVIGASGTPHRLDAQDFQMEDGKRYIVNVGAVGLPRDPDGRASYAIYDDAARTVEFRRVPFDMDAFRDDVARSGLAPADVPLLGADPRRRLAALREEPDFAPPRRAEDEAHGVVSERPVEVALRRKAARWRTAAIAAALAAVVLASGVAALLLSRGDQQPSGARDPLDTPDSFDAIATSASGRLDDYNVGANVLPALPSEIGPDGRFGGWGLHLDDRRNQLLTLVSDIGPDGKETPMLRITNADGHRTIRIESPEYLVPKTGWPTVRVTSFARPGADFKGEMFLALEQRDSSGKVVNGDPKRFRPERKKGSAWFSVTQTWTKDSRRGLLKGASSIRLVFTGDYAGTLDLCDPRLEVRDTPLKP